MYVVFRTNNKTIINKETLILEDLKHITFFRHIIDIVNNQGYYMDSLVVTRLAILDPARYKDYINNFLKRTSDPVCLDVNNYLSAYKRNEKLLEILS